MCGWKDDSNLREENILMEKHSFSTAVPDLGWQEDLTIDKPVNSEEFTERFGVDPLSFALRQIIVNVQNVIRTAVKGTKTKDGTRDLGTLQALVDKYQPGTREIQPASIRQTTKTMKELPEDTRVKVAAILEMIKDDPDIVDKLAAAAAKKKAATKE